jgi:erythromycin esterase-like protein
MGTAREHRYAEDKNAMCLFESTLHGGSSHGQLLKAGVPASLTDWRAPQCTVLRRVLSKPLLQRAIAVIYRPETERGSHYFEAMLVEQFDAMI